MSRPRFLLLALALLAVQPLTAAEPAPWLLERGPLAVDQLPLAKPVFGQAWKAVYQQGQNKVAVFWSSSPWLLMALNPAGRQEFYPLVGQDTVAGVQPWGAGLFVLFTNSENLALADFARLLERGWDYFQKLPDFQGQPIFPARLPFP